MARGKKKSYHLFTQCGNKYYNANYFNTKVQAQPNGCIHWTGASHVQGYGMVGGVYVDSDQRFMTVTHRAAMELHLGRELKPGENVIHMPGCAPCCVNPAHLQIGDLRLRNAVMTANGTINGGPKHVRRKYNIIPRKQNRVYKYTDDQIQRIRTQSTQATAEEFGWSVARAGKIRWEMRRNFKWLPMPDKETK